MLEAAIRLARSGVPVFPVGHDKAPRTPRGFYDATTDVAVIKSWSWDGMIGATIPEGRVVLDVDPRNGGLDTLSVFPDLPPTRTAKTAGGGFHYWFAVPKDLQMRSTLGPGIDVKKAGKGYVVVPPSKGYAWVVGGKITAAPNWLLDELRIEFTDHSTMSHSAAKYFTFEQGTAYGLAARRRILEELSQTEMGGRNHALNKASFVLAQLEAGGELDRQSTIVELVRMADLIGLEPWEARNTIESGWKAGSQVPRQAPPRVPSK